MKILLTDGSGLTARQTANRLSSDGHHVEALAPDPLCLCRFTRHVHKIRRVPAYGPDPLGWLEVALVAYEQGRFDVLFPTQEQVAVLAAFPDRLKGAGVVTAVPTFAALAAVQDKLSASTTLTRLGIPQPASAVAKSPDGPDGWDLFPAFVKEPIGTASGGVRRVTSAAELAAAVAGTGGRTFLVQAAAEGPLAMCQSVFDHGSLVAFHANLRTGEGASGGASHKLGVDLPDARHWLSVLGGDLEWHGALSADVILTERGPMFIDINPRLVEPENAWRSGVDLVGALLSVALGSGHPCQPPLPAGRPGVATHQLLLAVLGAAQQGKGRRGVASELASAWQKTGAYSGSAEELTPWRHDLLGPVPLIGASAATLVRPATWSWFASGSVENYALSPGGWEAIVSAARTLSRGPL
jgi:hypothetical protein